MSRLADEKRAEWRTEAVEDFLKTVYLLEQQVAPVPTMLLARALNIAAPSVTDMIKRLSSGDTTLLEYRPYQGVKLNEEGRRIALEVIRHHRLLEVYLTRVLGYAWDEVHEEADRLEHYISEKLESRIADALDHPELDPHGDPIPALDGTMLDQPLVLLADLEPEQDGQVSRIADQSPQVLRYLSDLGMTPGAHVTLTSHAPLNDTVTVRMDDTGRTTTMSTHVARKILVILSPAP